MEVESRDSISLKPAELDELAQLLTSIGSPLGDGHLDHQVESFPLVASATLDGELTGFLFGSLERVGGEPCVLWGMGAARRSRQAGSAVRSMIGEFFRRAAISFPDEDVLVAGRVAHPSAYGLFGVLDDVVPRVGYKPTGEERAWGRRLARRFGCEGRYEDQTFRVRADRAPAPVLDTSTVQGGGRAASAVVAKVDHVRGEALITFGWARAEALSDGLGSFGR